MEEAIPAFFASVVMGLFYSIAYGVAAGFFFYITIEVVKGRARRIHPILWIATGLFIINFVILKLL
ncbi:hypothetical protein AKA01nite_00780 [Alkalibacterium kapii]|uniref:Guanine permease n=1 Tax=Alkalibacterium kapii TaxID=426704 RepID=A0A511AQV3_9LACT|nr:hypothetical protein AKA01nite_00780 [Alkalibacterium kapii]